MGASWGAVGTVGAPWAGAGVTTEAGSVGSRGCMGRRWDEASCS